MQAENLYSLYLLIKDLEQLKVHTRTAYTSKGKQESIAEHSWRVAMMSLIMAPSEKELDISKVLKLAIIHDLGELYEGDISAKEFAYENKKFKSELRSIHKIASYLPIATSKQMIDLWEEYYKGETPEAAFVKAIDKLETITQHLQGSNPPDFDYSFNLKYGIDHTNKFKITKDLRSLLNKETRYKAGSKDGLKGD